MSNDIEAGQVINEQTREEMLNLIMSSVSPKELTTFLKGGVLFDYGRT